MATKTSKEVQSDFLAIVKASPIATAVNGSVYRASVDSSYRPRDSRLEDVEVILTRASVAQLQDGVVTVLIYVPDIAPYQDGVFVEDGARTETIERIAQDWLDSHPEVDTGYRLWIEDAISTIYIPEINQHAVSVQIHYQYYE